MSVVVSLFLAVPQGTGGVCITYFLAVGRYFREEVSDAEVIGLGGLG